jgi:hypothetical protein
LTTRLRCLLSFGSISDCRRGLRVALSLAVAALLTGCAAVDYIPSDSVVPAISGKVHGGQFPLEGAVVTLYATSATATTYGAAGNVIGTGTTDSGGFFTISPSATSANCPSGQQAYITAAGGYPTNNSSLVNNSTLLLAALGDCKYINSNTTVTIDEITTVAAAYALSGFITTSASGSIYVANVGGPSATGLAHAFMNAAALADYGTGVPNATVTASSGGTTATGIIPVAEINTLANTMASCVNSATGSTACTKVFGFTPSITQVAPTNTLQAFVNLARNPYPSSAAMSSTSGLISYGNATGAPFVPYLSAAPQSDWSLSIVYSGGGIQPGWWLALDANDTVYVDLLSTTSSTPLLFGLSAYGNTVPAFATNPGTTTGPKGIAPDALGNIWVADNGKDVYQFSTSTGALNLTHTTGLAGGTWPVAVDAHNSMWFGLVAASGTNLEEVAYSGGTWATTGATSVVSMPGGPYGITIDADQNVWVACYYESTSGSTTTGTNTDACMVANNGTVSIPNYITTAPSTIAPLTATLSSSAYNPYAVSIDASGNAWYTILGGNTSYTTCSSSGSTSGIMEVVPSAALSASGITPQSFLLNCTAGAGKTSGNDIGNHTPEESAIDGSGTMFMGDVYSSAYGIHAYSTTNGYVLSPTTGFASCYLASVSSTTCATNASTLYPTYDVRGIAIDSTGSVWLNSSTNATVTQVIGLAAPTYPLLSAGKPGLSPGLTAVNPLP